MHSKKTIILIAILVTATRTTNWAAEPLLDSLGVRSGFSSHPSNGRFVQTELFSDINLPWNWNGGQGWWLHSQLTLSSGWLHRRQADAFTGSLGPQLCLRHNSFPVELVGGVAFTYLSRDFFDEWNLGSPLQFTSHIGLRWRPGRHWELGYRLQHTSNGGFNFPNPGLNLHMFLASYRF